MKKLLALFMSICILASTVPFNFAFADDTKEMYNKNISDKLSLEKDNSQQVQPYFVNDFRYRKVDVEEYEEWSEPKRVSDNITTGSQGGSISSSRTRTFNTVISGSIHGLGISTGKSITSSIGYTLHVDPYSTVYLGYKVYYEVESGKWEYYDIVTDKVISSGYYTVKKPIKGEYVLVED